MPSLSICHVNVPNVVHFEFLAVLRKGDATQQKRVHARLKCQNFYFSIDRRSIWHVRAHFARHRHNQTAATKRMMKRNPEAQTRQCNGTLTTAPLRKHFYFRIMLSFHRGLAHNAQSIREKITIKNKNKKSKSKKKTSMTSNEMIKKRDINYRFLSNKSCFTNRTSNNSYLSGRSAFSLLLRFSFLSFLRRSSHRNYFANSDKCNCR